MDIQYFVFFYTGSLGDTFLARFMFYHMHRIHPQMRCIALTFYKSQPAVKLLADLDYVQVVAMRDVSWRDWLRLAFNRTLLAISFSFGKIPLLNKLIAWSLTRFPGSRLVGFTDASYLTRLLYTYTLPFDSSHSVFDAMRDVLRTFGVVDTEAMPDLPIPQADVCAKYSLTPKRYIVLHPFAHSMVRSWPPSRLHTLLIALQKTYPHLRIVLTGDARDHVRIERVIQDIPGIIDLADMLSIEELICLYYHAATFVGVDTGPTHIAAFSAHDIVVLSNNSNPCWQPTYEPLARILVDTTRCTCDGMKGGGCRVSFEGQEYYRCLFDISDEAILESVRASLASRGIV